MLGIVLSAGDMVANRNRHDSYAHYLVGRQTVTKQMLADGHRFCGENEKSCEIVPGGEKWGSALERWSGRTSLQR